MILRSILAFILPQVKQNLRLFLRDTIGNKI